MEAADFSGYATKAGLKCSDGRTITAEAFKHMDGQKVPLVWQHAHNSPENVLGHAILEARADGMYAYGFFNDTPRGQQARTLVQHDDVRALSIYANQLMEKAKTVLHGTIREVSLVLSGANPGAFIDQVRIAHSSDPSDIETLEDEAIISTMLELEHGDMEVDEEDEEEIAHTAEEIQEVLESLSDEQQSVVHQLVGDALTHAVAIAPGDDVSNQSVQEIYDAFSDEQKMVVHYMIGVALEQDAAEEAEDDNGSSSAAHSSTSEGNLNHQEGTDQMTRNVFEQNGAVGAAATQAASVLSHSDIATIFENAKKGGSFKDALLAHVEASDELKHGIENIDLLFPNAVAVTNDPQFVSRRMEWVQTVLDGTKHSPFAKVKTLLADITADEARAKGYVKGNLKTEEVLTLLRRTTSPATIYKKQKLDRDDILDITDMDIVLWLRVEMRLMIEEELARAILVGDGRSNLSPDKVKDPAGAVDGVGIRSILHDDDLYAIKFDLAANVSAKDAVKGLVRARTQWRGTGKPTLFVSSNFLTDIMLEEDKFGRPLYETEQVLVDKLRVDSIVTVNLFDEHAELFAIMVNLNDYTIGANRGGELTSFEFFDIDYNQNKFLQETRLSGGLTVPLSAIVIRRSAGSLATASSPSYDGTTHTVTIPTVTGVEYLVNGEVATGDVVITAPTEVEAVPTDGYYLSMNSTRTWNYTP